TLLLALSGLAHASIAVVQVPAAVNFAGFATGSITFASNVTAGDYIIAMVTSSTTSSPPPTSVTDTNSDTLITPLAWTTGATGFNSEGVYAFHVGTGGASFKITVNFAAGNTFTIMAFEVSGVGATLTDVTSAVNTGTSTAPSAASLTPTVAGDLQVAFENQGAVSSWDTGLTQQINYDSISPHAGFATQSLATTSPASASATLASSSNWSMMQFLVKASGGSSCTHSGWQSNGTLSVPNGTTGSYWLKNGTFGTPDCSTVNYWQPTVGNFGVN